MSKTKLTSRPHYELLYIISNEYTEEEVKPIHERVKQLIVDGGGEITFEQDWGKKRLAYTIKKFTYGYYHLFEFDLDSLSLAKVERTLRLANDILRHQIVRKDPRKARIVKERILPVEEKPEVKAVKPVKEVKAPKPVMDKADLKDLDDKLDKILETSDLL